MKDLSFDGWNGLPLFCGEGTRGDAGTEAVPRASLLLLHGIEKPAAGPRYSPAVKIRSSGKFDFHTAGHDSARARMLAFSQTLVVVISPDWRQQVDQRAGMMIDPPPRFQFRSPELERWVLALLDQCLRREPQGALYTRYLSLAIVQHLFGDDTKGYTDRFSPAVRRLLCEYIDEHLGRRVSLPALAVLAGLSPRSFAQRFRATFGQSVHQHVLTRRIDLAKMRLAQTEVSIIGLALELGFASHSHFSTAFRSRTGVSPSVFRQEVQRRQGLP